MQINLFRHLNKTYLVLVVLGLLIALFYGNTLTNGFVLDDFGAIVKNEHVHSLKYLPKIITSCLWEAVDGSCKGTLYPYYRPMHFLFLLLPYQISSEPWIFHLVNLLFLLGAAFAVFLFFRTLTKNFSLAFLTALFLIIHPVNSEVINWISALPDILVVFFGCLTLFFCLKYRERESLRNFLLIYVFYFFAILSKETAVFLPMILGLIDLFFFKLTLRQLFQGKELKKYLLFSIPLAIYLLMKFSVFGFSLGGNARYFSFLEGVHARITLFAQYISKFFYPYPLTIFYPFKKSSNFLSIQFLLSFLLTIIFFLLLFVFVKKRNSLFIFSLTWFLIFLSPVIIFLVGEPDHMFSKRYLFVPGIGFSFILAYLFSYAFSKSKVIKYAALLGLSFIMIISWLMIFPRNKDWKNEKSLYLQTLRYYPEAHEVRRKLGEIYFIEGEYETAREEFEEIIKRDENWKDITMAYKGLGDYYRAKNDLDNALLSYQKAVQTAQPSPRDYITFNDLGVAYMDKKNYLKGLIYFCQSLQLLPPPENQTAMDNLNAAISVVDTTYTKNNVLYQNIVKEFYQSSQQKIKYLKKECSKNTCQYMFSFYSETPEIILPFLISAATLPDYKDIKIEDSSFDQQQGIINLMVDLKFNSKDISFVFPTCQGIYYLATAE
jgi:tetratricopeptide (TPR) repeat protein